MPVCGFNKKHGKGGKEEERIKIAHDLRLIRSEWSTIISCKPFLQLSVPKYPQAKSQCTVNITWLKGVTITIFKLKHAINNFTLRQNETIIMYYEVDEFL